jgi:hypothetical protein
MRDSRRAMSAGDALLRRELVNAASGLGAAGGDVAVHELQREVAP